ATGWMTLGQFSEIFFMLALPFFTKRFGYQKVLLLGLVTATGWMTLGQFSEIFFMLALPFFTKRFGYQKVL
ncbi:hypothetical protein VS883_28760, partial [Escherichia coli]